MDPDRKQRSKERVERAERRQRERNREKKAAAARKRKERIDSLSFSRKLDRAGEHIEDLCEVTKEWLGTDAYRLVAQTNPQTSRTTVCAHITKPPPPRLAVLLGDAVHNLRSCLDHLVLELAVAYHKPRPVPPEFEDTSAFPIFPEKVGNELGVDLFHRVNKKTGDPVRGSGLYAVREIHPDAIKAIELIQPYKRGAAYAEDPLWAIHELDRIDKHRRLNLTAYALGSVGLNPAPGGGYIEHLHIEHIGHAGPVKHGTEVAAFVARNASFQLNFSREIALAESTLPQGGDIAKVVAGLRDHVRDKVVPIFQGAL